MTFLFVNSCKYINKQYCENIIIESVIDGDTYKSHNKTFRLLGIDTPETIDKNNNFLPTQGKQYFYGNQAKIFIKTLIEKKEVSVLNIKKDKYDRYVTKLSYQNMDIASLLIEYGYGVVRYIDSNKKSPFYYWDKQYIFNLWDLQLEAKNNKRGFWCESKQNLKQIFPDYNFI